MPTRDTPLPDLPYNRRRDVAVPARVYPRTVAVPATAPPGLGRRLGFVYHHRPRCPQCQGDNLRVYKTLRHDAALLRYTCCRGCGERFKAVVR